MKIITQGLVLSGLLAVSAGVAQAVVPPGATQGGRSGELIAMATLLPMSEDEFTAAQAAGGARIAPLDGTAPGETLFFGLFAAGFSLRDGAVDMHCRVTLATPDGWRQQVSDAPCARGEFDASPRDAYLLLGFDFAVPGALAGRQLIVTAEVVDEVTGASVPLAVAATIDRVSE
ncbi:hypothetical protein [Pararhodobacter aggregans]|uniref:Uncharacterized protein n=1 Tax=Pararhodobacter aggregans TaxID=404875 RepID=A0A2T7UQR9_9RHOB|nr:hypothetical protein [Pararhodobacter aggregans]PTX01811.1 hypothetical protein C8N33_10628 [Pararhodobacter aggregans]PVE47012.1 hypothetical protein DDE23_12170 [Pararhodobacter aggregans]